MTIRHEGKVYRLRGVLLSDLRTDLRHAVMRKIFHSGTQGNFGLFSRGQVTLDAVGFVRDYGIMQFTDQLFARGSKLERSGIDAAGGNLQTDYGNYSTWLNRSGAFKLPKSG